MSAEQRPAEPGEWCACGRQAVTVYLTDQFGEVGHCGHGNAEHVTPCPFCGAEEPHEARCPSYTLRATGSVIGEGLTVLDSRTVAQLIGRLDYVVTTLEGCRSWPALLAELNDAERAKLDDGLRRLRAWPYDGGDA